jgi:tetratricopeptide (TPR) repeat protein
LKQNPKSYDAIVGLGIAQRGRKQLDQAEASYKKAADLDQVRADAYFNLGVLYKDFRANETQDLRAAQGHYRTAIKYFQQAAGKPNADPELQKEARENISDCEKNLRSLDEAIRFQQSQPAGSKAGGGK